MNSMDVVKTGPEVFEITRRTPRARALSWVGTGLFVTDLLFSYPFVSYFTGLRVKFLDVFKFKTITDVVIYRWSVFAILFLLLAIILWTASHKAQQGTISFCDDRIICKCERSTIEFLPGQISSVNRNDNVVKINFVGRTLTIKSEKAPRITEKVQDFISAYEYSGRPNVSVSSTSNISADKIREYKQLVDDGIITQEQFDAIIKKITKS